MTACYIPWQNTPPQGEHRLGIPFQHQQGDQWCALACVSMWVKFKGTPFPAEQQDIFDHIWWESAYWWTMGYGGSLSNDGVRFALQDYSGIIAENDYYYQSEYRNVIGDIQKGISAGNPTIVITNSGIHAKLVTGASWHQLGNYQPNVDVIVTADPWDWGPRVDTVGYWLSNVGSGDPSGSFINTIHSTGQKWSSLAELNEFDSWGGTYYGDPEPPDGCEDCLPIADEPRPTASTSGLRTILSFFNRKPPTRLSLSHRPAGLAAPSPSRGSLQGSRRQPVGAGFQRRHAVRREIFVPWPQAASPQRVVENMLAGMRQMKLAGVAGWEALERAPAAMRASAVERVVSLSGDLQYWLITVRVEGRPYAKAIVSLDGWLLSAMRVDEDELEFEPKTVDWAQRVVAGTGSHSKSIRLVHLLSNLAPHLGSEDYSPLFEVATEGGETMYVTQSGEVFRPEVAGNRIGLTRQGRKAFARIR